MFSVSRVIKTIDFTLFEVKRLAEVSVVEGKTKSNGKRLLRFIVCVFNLFAEESCKNCDASEEELNTCGEMAGR